MKESIKKAQVVKEKKEGVFELVSKYSPSGDQPQAIKSIIEGLKRGDEKQVILGVTGSGKTFTMANIINQMNRPAMIMAPNKTLAAQLYAELRDFFPKNAVEYFVSYYDYYQPEAYVPARDLFIEKDSSINEHIEQMRLSATKALLERQDVIIVATVSAIYGLGSPDCYHEMILTLRKNGKISRKEIIQQLVKMQYRRSDQELQRGYFRIRGDHIDIFPAENYDHAIRVELWENEIEKITAIDFLTGKVIQSLTRFNIYPASHYVTPEARLTKAVDSIEEELKKRQKEYKQLKKEVELQRITSRTEFDLEMIREIGFCKGIENYSRHLSEKEPGQPPDTLLDYLPENALLFMDESHISVGQVGAMSKGDASRKQNLVDFGFRLPSALDNRPLNFKEFENRMPQTIFVSATPAEYELEKADNIVELVIRPTGIVDPEVEVRPAVTQIDDLMNEIVVENKKGSRTLVTCLTKKLAEQITEFLNENGIKSKYLHSEIDNVERVELLRELRKGTFDVLVGINLLREGLDLPEVGLVAVLDADKEGFLRSERSLIQTMGRAARNPEGRVILYADKVTESMKKAMEETDRRRQKQRDYNEKMNIKPAKAISEIKELIDGVFVEKQEKKTKKEESQDEAWQLFLKSASLEMVDKKVIHLNKEMFDCAKNLEFEKAAKIRDQIKELNELRLKL